jgi:transposase
MEWKDLEMRSGLFWLNDAQWARIEGFLSLKRKGAHRADDRRVISGIIHVIQTGTPWRAAPSEYGSAKTLYKRFYRWFDKGLWKELFAGDTFYAWSEVLDKTTLPHRSDVGALRLRTIATRDAPCTNFPDKEGETYPAHILLDLDYWVLMMR